MPPATWQLVSSAAPGGALAVVLLRGPIDDLLAAVGARAVAVGDARVRRIAGVDGALVARPTAETALVSVHAGPAVVRALTEALGRAGATRATNAHAWDGAWCGAPGGGGKGAEIDALAMDALAKAASPRALPLLLQQRARWAGIGVSSPADAPPDPRRERVLARLMRPAVVMAAGWANVGKSTLLNALADRDVARVAPEPGTTRDHVGALVDLDGLVVRWIDTPGLRAGADDLEREAWTLVAPVLARAAAVVLVSTPERPPPELGDVFDAAGPGACGMGAPSASLAVVRVATHADVGSPVWRADAAVCAPRGEGLGNVATLVRRALVPDTELARSEPWRFWVPD